MGTAKERGETTVEENNRIAQVMDEMGLNAWGICGFEPLRPFLLPCRAAARLPSCPQAVICVLFPYHVPLASRNLSRYAVGPDYHSVVRELLAQAAQKLQNSCPTYQFVPFTDSSPIPEVRAAVACGLGVQGDNGLFIHPQYGSWVFIGELVTDAPLPVNEGKNAGCLHCGACARRCPANALQSGGRIGPDAGRCLSALTQKKGELTQEQAALLHKGGSVWGCDICQEVCPMNRGISDTALPQFRRELHPVLLPGESRSLPNRAYHWRPAAVIERNLRILCTDDGNAKGENQPAGAAETPAAEQIKEGDHARNRAGSHE